MTSTASGAWQKSGGEGG